MNEIEKIQRYIDGAANKFPAGTPYQMGIDEMFKLSDVSKKDAIGALCMAFNYGRAKDYRAAKAEARREQDH